MGLSEVAATITAARPAYTAAVVGVLSRTNDLILQIRDRALGVYERRLAKLEDQKDAAARERQAALEPARQEIARPARRRRKKRDAEVDR